LKIGTELDAYPSDEAVRIGVLAERIGFDSVWVNDHLIDGVSIDPWTTLAAVAVQTDKVFLCSTVTDPLRTHPAKIAQIVLTLNRIANGRAGLGIGAGEAMNIVPFGMPWDSAGVRRERLSEAVQVIKMLWGSSRESTVNFQGKHFTLNKAWLDQPADYTPPLYIGSLGAKKTLEIVGTLGDGWDSFLNTPESFKERFEIVKSSARKAGRDPEKIEPIAEILTSVAWNDEGYRAALDKTKLVLLVEGMMLKYLGVKLPPGLERTYQNMLMTNEDGELLVKYRDTVSDEIAKKFLAGGSPEKILERIQEFRDAGVNHLLIQFMEPGEASLRKFSEKVLMRVNRSD